MSPSPGPLHRSALTWLVVASLAPAALAAPRTVSASSPKSVLSRASPPCERQESGVIIPRAQSRGEALDKSAAIIVFHYGAGIHAAIAVARSLVTLGYAVVALDGGRSGRVELLVDGEAVGTFRQADVDSGRLALQAEIAADRSIGPQGSACHGPEPLARAANFAETRGGIGVALLRGESNETYRGGELDARIRDLWNRACIPSRVFCGHSGTPSSRVYFFDADRKYGPFDLDNFGLAMGDIAHRYRVAADDHEPQ